MITIPLHRKERIVLTAVEIIDELGIQGLSSRELAKRQEISEGTLFKHFRNKNEIILAVLDHYAQFDDDIAETIQMKNMNFREAITYGVIRYMEYFENYPAITSILHVYETWKNEEELASRVREIFDRRIHFIKQLVEQSKQREEIVDDIDSEGFADILLGFCRTMTLRWRMSQYGFPLKERASTTLQMILKAFLQETTR